MSPLWLPWGCGSPGTPCDCDDPYRTSRPYATNPGCSLDRHILSSPGYVRCWTSSGPSITHPRCSFAWPPSGSPLSPFDFDDPSHMSRPCATPIAFLCPTLQTLVVHVIVHVYIYIYYHLFYNRLYYMYIYIFVFFNQRGSNESHPATILEKKPATRGAATKEAYSKCKHNNN